MNQLGVAFDKEKGAFVLTIGAVSAAIALPDAMEMAAGITTLAAQHIKATAKPTLLEPDRRIILANGIYNAG
jgi:hypothetical protein